jgi:hypothetical protein
MQINFQDYNTALRIINLVFKTTNFKNTQEWKLIKCWQDQYLHVAWQRSFDHQKSGRTATYISRNESIEKNCWLYSFGPQKKWANNRGNYNNAHSRVPTTKQKKLVATCKLNGTFQTTKQMLLYVP